MSISIFQGNWTPNIVHTTSADRSPRGPALATFANNSFQNQKSYFYIPNT